MFSVEDIDATGWESELAVVASSRQEAYRVLRGRGVRKKDHTSYTTSPGLTPLDPLTARSVNALVL